MGRPDPPLPPTPSITSQSNAVLFWNLLEESIRGGIQEEVPVRHPRVSTLIIPIAGLATPSTGWLTSFGVAFSARVVAYQIFALVPGQMTIDFQHSTPNTHPTGGIGSPLQFPTMIGDPALLPAINGVYSQSLDTSGWAIRELMVGDMVQVYVQTASGIAYCTMILYLQDLDERT